MHVTIRQEDKNASMTRLLLTVRSGETGHAREEEGVGQEEIIIRIVQLKGAEIQDIHVFRML
jgi:3-dehydroquinate dehydratase